MSEDVKTDNKKIMAICYDFDKTLSPDDMQSFTLIPSLEMDPPTFWEASNKLAKDNLMDQNLAWMQKLIVESKAKRKPLSRDYFHAIGKDIKLYRGVKGWFKRINAFGEKHGVEIYHFIISSGLKEIIEGTPIASQFKKIYASTYLYDADGVAEWPAQVINYTTKTQFIFRIAKGVLEEWDESVNDSMSHDKLFIPYQNIVYIGDSATDIPCMRLVKKRGGFSIGVFDPEKNRRDKVYSLIRDKRIDYYAKADYSDNSELDEILKKIILAVAANSDLKEINYDLRTKALPYEVYMIFKNLFSKNKKLKKDEKRLLEMIRAEIEGNID